MIRLNMLSSAEKVKGQGVASAYRELVHLITSHTSHYHVTVNKAIAADITHYHTIDPLFYLSTFSKHRGTKIGHVHFIPQTIENSLDLPSPIQAIFYRYIVQFYRRMDKLVVVNPSFISVLTALGIDRQRIYYIPNFVSKQTFYPMNRDQHDQLKHEHHLTNKFIVLAAGQIQHRKGVLDFIRTAKEMPDVQFVWVGGFSFGQITSGYKELKQIYDHPPSNVRFTGIVDREKMNAYFNMADVFFLPSFNELFPMTILEAMNCEKPILLRDLAVYEDILSIYYLKGDSVTAFVKQLNQLKQHSSYYVTAVKKAREGAHFYNEDRILDIWNGFYHEACHTEVPVLP